MQSRYKVVISNRNLYKEVDLLPDAPEIRVGTETDCEVRLRKDLFFEQIVLEFVQQGDQWSITCSDNLYIDAGDVRKLMTKVLNHGDVFTVKYQGSNNDVFTVEFLIDFDNAQRRYERAIDISACSTIRIGVDNFNQIVISSPFVRNDSIELNRTNNGYALKVLKTTYGVYHNGSKASGNCIIKNGDFFSISDFIFYIKDGYIWTEIRDGVTVNGLNFGDYALPNLYPKFTRNSRVKNILDDNEIVILDPPTKPEKPKNNLFMTLLPSLGMLVASGAMAAMGGSTMIIFSAISGCMAIVTSVVGMVQQNKDFKVNSEKRIVKYRNYIDNKKTEIQQFRNQERETLEKIYLSPEGELDMLYRFSSDLFDRLPNDNDYLCVRLGTGDIIANRKINYKKQERLEVEDDLQIIPENLSEEEKILKSAPVVCDLKKANAIGIVGLEEYRFALLKNILLDLCIRQYHSDVGMFIISKEENKQKINWLRFIPNFYNDVIGTRNIVCDDDSKNRIFDYLYKELTQREQGIKGNNLIVFFYDEYGFQNHPISKFISTAKDLGVTFVFMADNKSLIPLGCDYLIQLNSLAAGDLIETANIENVTSFTFAPVDNDAIQRSVELLAPVYTEEISLEGSLTKNISLFELLNILSVDDLDLQKRWDNSRVTRSMSAPLGVSKQGVVYLDLHDKAHGPHGLVAGTTGSGKSEILQTYILSMATLFPPYEVGFVIIDFKGGGMVNQFKNLPHLLGAITNIDGKEIDRSLKSIKAELQKRQRLFAEVEVNHIDKYIQKFKSGEANIPLPHLILIVDEFAELKAEQPEFMQELISAARIGRSLGVHLILATQKPSGQVNEQIWSNSRFKLCLKVQSQEDSNEVLKSPLAAEIKEPGRAYLQVGNNEVFELFQSAYSGAPEKADDTAVKEFSIYSLTSGGKRNPVYSQKRKKIEGANSTQLDAIVNFVANHCNNSGIERLPNICLPSLMDYMTIPDSLDEYCLDSLPLGIYDDPDLQYQGFASFNLCEDNTMIIGSSQTGKTNLIQCIIRLVTDKFSPQEAVFYIADFGAMYLKNFESLHHVGGVVTISESEKFKNLFKLLTEEVQYRKTKFLDCGLSSYVAYCEAGYNDLPHIFFVIDNFSAFKEVYADDYEDQFIYLTREGISCGISIVVTNASTSGLGYRYMSNFGCRLAFTCNDTSEYMNIFDRCRMQPKEVPGRMLCKLNKELYEMQSFIAFEGEKEFERSTAVKRFVEETNNKYPDITAKKIPSIPEVLTLDYIDANYNNRSSGYQYPIALDYSNVDIVWLDLKTTNEFCIVGKLSEKNNAAMNSIFSAFHHFVLEKPVKLYIIDSVDRPFKSKGELPYVDKYTIDYSEIGSIFDEIRPEMEMRHKLLMDGDFDAIRRKEQIIVLINSRETIEYISSTKELLESYAEMVKQFKGLNLGFIFSDIEDASIGYNAPELLKRFKEAKKMIITSPLAEFKFCDLPSNAVRNNKTVNVGDSFILSGSEISRIKLVEEEQL